MKLGRKARQEIRAYLGPALYTRLLDRLETLPDADAPDWLPILVRDASGRELEYGSEIRETDPARARAWLGVDPHRSAPRHLQRPEDSRLEWDFAASLEVLNEDAQRDRNALADAARSGNWDAVLAILRTNPAWVNASRPGGSSGYAALHQAAYSGASPAIVEALLDAGAWRLLRATSGEMPVDVAVRRGHRHIIGLLTPRPVAPVESEDLRLMETYLHAAINGRAAHLVREHQLRLPMLEPLQEIPMCGVWMPVPGMAGGFHYWLARGAPDPLVITESWSRMVDGSGQRHEVTTFGIALVAEGFV